MLSLILVNDALPFSSSLQIYDLFIYSFFFVETHYYQRFAKQSDMMQNKQKIFLI